MREVSTAKFQADEHSLTLRHPGGEARFDGTKVRWNFGRGAKVPQRKAHAEFFDADAVGEEIVLRHWRAGDRFQPIGMQRDVKLQDVFVNKKIPREHRHEIVVAATRGGEIFWVEDLRIGERFKVTPTTKRILKWRWQN